MGFKVALWYKHLIEILFIVRERDSMPNLWRLFRKVASAATGVWIRAEQMLPSLYFQISVILYTELQVETRVQKLINRIPVKK